jgi:hypothetical protein
MEDTIIQNALSNSFYYFYSATPQVLGGIMALFAVFVIFKIQALKDELLSLAQYLHNTLHGISEKGESAEMQKKRGKLAWEIKRNIEAKNIVQVYEAIKRYNDELHTTNKVYKVRKERFDDVYSIKENLVSDTITASTITAFIVLFCLGILPFGKLVICHTIFMGIIFGVVLLCVGIIFYKLLSILKKSFN